ncbi:unnamed protein product, partial [Rotaria socialis]
ENSRLMRWTRGAEQGTVIPVTNGLVRPMGLSFDRDGNLYVADSNNHRVQRFSIEKDC